MASLTARAATTTSRATRQATNALPDQGTTPSRAARRAFVRVNSMSGSGYVTKAGDFFLGRTGQDCASVCFLAGRTCESSLDVVGRDTFVQLGLECHDLPAELTGATTSRYPFPGWISEQDNLFYGSCFNVNGAVGGEVQCSAKWDAASRVCRCTDDR